MTHLKSILSITLLLTITFSNAQWWSGKGTKGNGDVKTITRTTSDYHSIKCSGFMDFKLVEGEEGKITIKGESNLLEYIITEVNDGKLTVKVKKGKSIYSSNNKPLLITIPYKSIDKVSLAGSGDVWNTGTITSNDFRVSLAGSGDLILNIDAKSVTSSIAGSGDLTLTGKTTNLKTSIAGSGDFHGFKLDSKNVNASIAGSGDISINCSGELKARVAGSGDIEYRGNPRTEDTKVSGSGSIEN